MKRSIAIAAVAVSAVLAGGTALALTNDGSRGGESREGAQHVRVAAQADDTDDTDRVNGTDDTDDTDRTDTAARPTVTTSHLTIAQAIDAALAARPGTVLSAGLDTDDDDGDRDWEVEILGADAKTYELHLDPATGKVLATHTDPDRDRTPQGLTARQAADAAAPKGTVLSVDFDEDHSGIWEVETHDAQGKERDWNVNAKTGTVTADRED
ncbi:PepSY domain-containing protein [Streptomyces sp. 4F14]|uniref:PepSY domain-containing protein n=1 Tax=Streptomyces sp. 4F14 TaxID=3394380 RepID=UPI003A850DE7